MIQTDKLVQFYCAQYKTFAKKKHKKTIPETGPYPKRMQRLSKELLAIHSPKIKQPQLENYHRQLRNLSYFVYRDANPIYIIPAGRGTGINYRAFLKLFISGNAPCNLPAHLKGFVPSVWTIWNASSDCRDGSVETGNRISTDQRHAAAFYPACWSYQLWQNLSRIRAFKRGFVRSLSWSFASSGAGNL